MPDYEFTSPEGKSYSITGPEGSTREEAFGHLPEKFPELQGKPGFEKVTAAAPPSMRPPQQPPQPGAGEYIKSQAGDLGRQMGLTLRDFGVAAGGMLTGPADLMMQAAHGAQNLLQGPTSQQPYSFTETMKKGIVKTGLPTPTTEKEKTSADIVEAAPLIGAGLGLAKVGAQKLGGKIADAYHGKVLKEATAKATGAIAQEAAATQRAYESAAAKQQASVRRAQQEGQSAAVQRQRLEEINKKHSAAETTGLHKIGTDLEGTAKTALDAGHQARANVAKVNYGAASEQAAAKEAKGDFANIDPARKVMEKLQRNTQGIPALGNEIDRMSKMLSDPEGAGATELLGGAGSGRNHENLKEIMAFLNREAHKGNLKHTNPTAFKTMAEAEAALMKAVEEHTPAFRVAHDTYREMSVPLEALDTRLGKAITGGEGGITGDAFRKTPADQLPGKFFGDKEGVDLLVNMIAGGRNAGAVERAAAETEVQKLALKYFTTKLQHASEQKLSDFLRAPENRGALEAMPKVKASLTRQSTEATARAARIKALTGVEERAGAKAIEAAAGAKKLQAATISVRNELFVADTNAASTSQADRVKAYSQYSHLLERMVDTQDLGTMSRSDYKAIKVLLARAQTAQEKLKIVQAIGRGVLYLTMPVRGAAHAAGAVIHGSGR